MTKQSAINEALILSGSVFAGEKLVLEQLNPETVKSASDINQDDYIKAVAAATQNLGEFYTKIASFNKEAEGLLNQIGGKLKGFGADISSRLESLTPDQKNALIGALVGTGAGTGIGAAVDGARGALIGGVGGGALGAFTGKDIKAKAEKGIQELYNKLPNETKGTLLGAQLGAVAGNTVGKGVDIVEQNPKTTLGIIAGMVGAKALGLDDAAANAVMKLLRRGK
jgi:outer membrane lipoprotein SlyB